MQCINVERRPPHPVEEDSLDDVWFGFVLVGETEPSEFFAGQRASFGCGLAFFGPMAVRGSSGSCRARE